MSNIGNMHTQKEVAIFKAGDADGIINILCVRAINGANDAVCQVNAPRFFVGQNLLRDFF